MSRGVDGYEVPECPARSQTPEAFRRRGLQLWVQPSGGRLWRLAYRFGGKQKLLALAAYPTISLADARQARDEARRLLAAGVDPAQEKRGRKALEDDRGDIFRVVAEEYVSKLKHEGRTAATITKIEWLLAFPHPALGDQAMAAFSRLREISGDGGLPFPGVRTPTRPISDNTLNAALRRLGYGTDDVTAHGFRATACGFRSKAATYSDLMAATVPT